MCVPDRRAPLLLCSIAVPTGAAVRAGRRSTRRGYRGYPAHCKRGTWAAAPSGRASVQTSANPQSRLGAPPTQTDKPSQSKRAFPKETLDTTAKPFIKTIGEADTISHRKVCITASEGERISSQMKCSHHLSLAAQAAFITCGVSRHERMVTR